MQILVDWLCQGAPVAGAACVIPSRFADESRTSRSNGSVKVANGVLARFFFDFGSGDFPLAFLFKTVSK